MAIDSPEGNRLRRIKTKESSGDPENSISTSVHHAKEPLSPIGRMFIDTVLHCNVICVIAFKCSISVSKIRNVLKESILKHKRFQSKVDGYGGSHPKWAPTTVRIEDHVHEVSPDSPGYNDPSFLEDFVSDLTARPELDASRPLWEAYVLNVDRPDSKGQCVFRIHHSLGDGTSLMSLLLSSTRQVAHPELRPSIPGQSLTVLLSESGSSPELVSRPPPPPKNLLENIWRGILALFYTNVFVAQFLAAALVVSDSKTPIKGESGGEKGQHRFLFTEALSMEDVTAVRKAVKGSTVNDVIMAVISGGVQLYVKSKQENLDLKKVRVRGLGLVNLRSAPGLQEFDDMLTVGSQARWGNHMGYLLLPLVVEPLADPLDRVRKIKEMTDCKKLSYEGLISYVNGQLLSATAGTRAIGLLTYRVMNHTTMAISNMIGPREEVSLGGYPISFIVPTVDGTPQSLTVHAQTYNGTLRIAMLAATDYLVDPNALRVNFEEAFRQLVDAIAM